MEVRFQVDDKFISLLRDRLNYSSYTELAKDALTLLNWASEEAVGGRVILSGTPKGTELARLVLPKLEEVRSKATIVPMEVS